MTSVVLKPQAKQLFEVQPQQSHPKLSLRRVLWIKLLRWIDKATFEALRKTLIRSGMSALILLGVMLPDATLKTLYSLIAWNSFRIPIALLLLASLLNSKRLFLFVKRLSVRRRGSNQHTYHGIPCGEFASWLIESRAFKRDEATRTWGLSQGKYQKIAAELEQHGILTRGENNARVLRDITLEQLVMQLRDDFPLVWSEERQVWAERNGAFERWALSHDFQRRKLEDETARKERKLRRIERRIEQGNSTFANLFSPATGQ